MFVIALLLGISLDWAKTCKAINYEFKQFGVTKYGYGCKKGCFGYANTTTAQLSNPDDTLKENGRRPDGDHYKQEKCEDCSMITASFIKTYILEKQYQGGMGIITESNIEINTTEMEKVCNGEGGDATVNFMGTISETSAGFYPSGGGCLWKKDKCGAISCPKMTSMGKCNGNWTDGKCKKYTKSDYQINSFEPYNVEFPGYFSSGNYEFYLSDVDKTNTSGCARTVGGNPNYVVTYQSNYPGSTDPYAWVTCDDLTKYYHSQRKGESGDLGGENYECVKYTADHVTECNYRREKPSRRTSVYTYEYTKNSRKACHQLYGCLYSGRSVNECSTWSIWAFVLTLIILIVVVVGGVVFVIVAHFVLKLF